MLKSKLRRLEAFGKRLLDGVLDNATACEADKRMGLRDDDVALHGERSGNATRGRVGDHRDVQEASASMAFDGGADLAHLHQRHQALLHAGSARSGEDEQRQALVGGALNRTGDLLAHNRAHGAHHERGLHDADGNRAPIKLHLARAHALVKAALCTLLLNQIVEVRELKRVALLHGGVPFLEASLVEQQRDALARGKAIQLAAGRAHAARCQHRLLVVVHLALRATAPIRLMLAKGGVGMAFHPQAVRAVFLHRRQNAQVVLVSCHAQQRIGGERRVAHQKRACAAHLRCLDHRIDVGEQARIEFVAEQGNASRPRAGKRLFLVLGAGNPNLAALVFHAGLHARLHGRAVANHQKRRVDCLIEQGKLVHHRAVLGGNGGFRH